MTLDIDVTVNGNPMTLSSSTGASLLRALRDNGVLSPKGACEEGRCGSCTVLLAREAVYSCLIPAASCEGATIGTVDGGVADDLTDALIQRGAVQCGFCTPGFVMAIEALLDRYTGHVLDDAQVRAGLSGNLCRCTGYEAIVRAALDVHRGRNGRRQ
jgi:aerobic-type carbon monoxide dehydrogenase small subunit (CoxS/CutS family)